MYLPNVTCIILLHNLLSIMYLLNVRKRFCVRGTLVFKRSVFMKCPEHPCHKAFSVIELCPGTLVIKNYEEIEDTKEVIRIRKSKLM